MPDEKPQETEYSSQNIPSFTPREHIRRRPGMYLGGTDIRGLHHLIWSATDHMLEEAMLGLCSMIRIEISDDNEVLIINDGTSLIDPQLNMESNSKALDALLADCKTRAPLSDMYFGVQGGLHGMGLSIVNCLSKKFSLSIEHHTDVWMHFYEQGLATDRIIHQALSYSPRTQTTIRFIPDFTIMDEGLTFDYTVIVERCQELVYLLPQLTLEIERDGDILSLHQPKGLVAWMADLNQHDECVHPILFNSLQTEYSDKYIGESKVKVELALQFRKHTDGVVMGFVNTILAKDGGTHIDGLRESLKQAIYGDNTPKTDNPLYGLTAVLHIYHPDPQSEGSMHLKLLNPDVKDAVIHCVQALFTENPTVLQSLQSHFLV